MHSNGRRLKLTYHAGVPRSVRIPFASPLQAELAMKVISVDKILRSDSVSRELRTFDNILEA